MKKELLIAALVALSALPAVAAQNHANSPDVPNVDTAPAPQATAVASESSSTSGSSSGSAASGAASDGSGTADWNYTRLYVEADDSYFDVKPGESQEFTVTVENGEDEAVDLNPHVYVPPTAQNPIPASWVEIEGDESLAAGAEAGFTVTVSVPEDAEIGNYDGMIAFTDEKITYPGRPPRPVHATHLGVEVWTEPTVKVLSDTYVHGQVEAGDSVTHQIVVKNTGDSAVPLKPELASERNHCRGSGCPLQLDPAWIDVDAPTEVAPGETATVTISMSPSADAERGRYDTRIDLGLKDPARPERDTYWQEVDLNYVVWKQPDEAFETSVDVSENARSLTLTLSPRTHSDSADSEPASFDVQFVSPDGETIDAERVRTTDRGFVDLGGRDRRSATDDGDYAVRSGGTEFVYRVDDPAAGEWTVQMTPHNTIGFNYELVRDESSRESTLDDSDE
jgi:hypothetical protein